MNRYLFGVLGSLFAFLGVALGAFGAHVLETRVSPQDLATFETAARYQLVHALALLVVALAPRRPSGASAGFSGWAFTLGILLFSGSLYLLVFSGLRWLGAVTPLGGVAFLTGWAGLAWHFMTLTGKERHRE